ncbi:MAG: hypothetical protein EOP51_00130 [Sphingobacteriales bacterium]|nr:MAG: hypothetical protein EOP51_00130 [Sphingobacteriales bacterium]
MRTKILIDSSIAFVVATTVEMTLHECGHFVATLAMGGQAILHHNYVEHNDVSDAARCMSALAGPVVSLVIGLVFQLVVSSRRFKSMTALTLQYLSIFGYIGFFGYVMIAPFFSYGDMGFVLRYIGCPMWLIFLLAALAGVALFFLGKAWSVHFIGMMSRATASDLKTRRQFIYSLVFFPLFVGIAITTLLNFPVPTPLSLIAPLTSPFVILWPFGYYLRGTAIYYDEEESIGKKIYIGGIVALIMLIVINRLLVGGFGG